MHLRLKKNKNMLLLKLISEFIDRVKFTLPTPMSLFTNDSEITYI